MQKVISCSFNDHYLGQKVPEKRKTFSSLGLVQKIMYSHHAANNTDLSTTKLISRVERYTKELLTWDSLYKGGFRKEKEDDRTIYINTYASKHIYVKLDIYLKIYMYLHIHIITHRHIGMQEQNWQTRNGFQLNVKYDSFHLQKVRQAGKETCPLGARG